jgi:orotate phosphoribosyltransferase
MVDDMSVYHNLVRPSKKRSYRNAQSMTTPTSSLASRIKASTKLTGNFVLRSGAVSHTYFDKYRFEADPTLLLDIATEMAQLVPPGTEVLAGLEMGGNPVVTILSQVTGLPAAFMRKKPKTYGTCQYREIRTRLDTEVRL